MRLVIIGAPGAGKGTQSAIICQMLKIPHLSTGDIFRKNIKEGTELGLKIKELISQGQFVSDEITQRIVEDRLKEQDCNKGFLLDGFPRNVLQAEFLNNLLSSKGLKLDYAINLIVPDHVIIERMSGRRVCEKCGASYHLVSVPARIQGICDNCGGKLIQREDDNPQTVIDRLDVYHKQTEPIIDYYRKADCILDILGKDTVEDTTNDILKVLGVLNASY